ncbi:restriction endonuclease subunit S [Ruminiclostridium cellulolyticum]|uniref:Restriction modification system DNA specificity domain protein n=1 Tax=Ruminiclostridium cellulolyticum (strain ATCC 35319 / DSM 5812 / JCM 6584 / H10) TaxID=394503 RepID=B8I7G4_RUMCH|nr:restriction endonuclease subunit S [Ruminiclostridium cellulolyticum]ACL77035.1 restriction modification system DNA specificity domain protein [Ruminiclostridium cellulolyticum H10]
MSNNIPEIRFKGFTLAWEQRTLGEMAEETYGGGTPSTLNKAYWNGNIPWIQSSDLVEHQLFGVSPRKYITESGVCSSAAKLVPENSIAIVTRVGVGKLATMPFAFATSQDFLSLSNLKCEIWFFAYSIYKKLQRDIDAVQGTSIKGITKNELLSKSICAPSDILEQTSIGNFLHLLDDAITLHKRKLDDLKDLKHGYLQQMFPQAGESVPLVRFAGFTEPWQKRTLGDVVECVTRKNKGLKSTLVLTISAQHGLIAQKDFFDKEVASKDVSNYYLMKNGEFAYNKSYSNGYPWGAVKRLDNYEIGVLSTLYIVFKPTTIDSEFLTQYYETTHWHNEVAQYAAEGARNHGLLNIATSDFFETVLAIPTNSNEQTAIGNFFHTLDRQIIAQEQKLNRLKQLKSAYLQKMLI